MAEQQEHGYDAYQLHEYTHILHSIDIYSLSTSCTIDKLRSCNMFSELLKINE